MIYIILFLILTILLFYKIKEPFYKSTKDCLKHHCLADPKYLCKEYCYRIGQELKY